MDLHKGSSCLLEALARLQLDSRAASAAIAEKSRLIRAANLRHTDDGFYNAQRVFFLTYKLHSNQKHYTSELIKRRFGEFFPLARAREQEPYLKILDIGSGDGDVSLPLFWTLKNDNADFVIHEPNLGMAARFLMNYMLHGQNFRRLGMYDNQARKGFVCKKRKDFDFILASHALYYVPDLEDSVQAIYDSLSPGGVAGIMLTAEGGFLHRLRDRFGSYFRDRNLCGKDICEILDARSIPHEKEKLESYTDITDCLFEMDPRDYIHLSIHGKNLVCFMLRTDYGFTRDDGKHHIVNFIRDNSFAKEGRDEVSAFMGCNEPHLTCKRGHDFYYREQRRYVKFTDDVIWMRKPGRYSPRGIDAKHRGLDEFGYEHDITVGEVKGLLRKHICEYIEKDLKGMDRNIVEAYVSFLIMDYFLAEPYYYTIVWGDHPFQPDVYSLDGQEYVGTKAAESLRIVYNGLEGNSLHDLHCTEFIDARKERASHSGGHPHCAEYLDDLLDTLECHLPKESKAVLHENDVTFRALVWTLYDRFKHHEVISVDGFSNFGEVLKQNPGHPYSKVDLSKFIVGYTA